MLTESQLPGDPFLRPVGKLPVFQVSQVAELLETVFGNFDLIYRRVRYGATQGLIHRRFAPGQKKTSPALFGADDVAAAAVIIALMNMGNVDRDVASLASLACYAWDSDINPRPSFVPKGLSPILAATRGIALGESWMLRVQEYWDTETHTRRLFAAVHSSEAEFPGQAAILAPSYRPGGMTSLWLPTYLEPLGRMFDLDPVPELVH